MTQHQLVNIPDNLTVIVHFKFWFFRESDEWIECPGSKEESSMHFPSTSGEVGNSIQGNQQYLPYATGHISLERKEPSSFYFLG